MFVGPTIISVFICEQDILFTFDKILVLKSEPFLHNTDRQNIIFMIRCQLSINISSVIIMI